MLQNQVAGRHGSYATQFWKASGAPRYRSRATMRVAYSRKAVDRRLVLPLDSHNWIRALEVLSAGYARAGRQPEHYQAVLRDMVEHHGIGADGKRDQTSNTAGENDERNRAAASPTGVAFMSATTDILSAVDGLRDKAYAGEIPANGSLWVTLVWSYCTLNRPQEGLDTFYQAQRRCRYSTPTLQHMAELLLPVLCRQGELDEATRLYEEHLKVDAGGASLSATATADGAAVHASGSGRRSRMDDAEARRWLAEAAARRGDWRRAQEFAVTAPEKRLTKVDGHGTGVAVTATSPVHRPTINSLFHSYETTSRGRTTENAGLAGTVGDFFTATAHSQQQLLPARGKALPQMSPTSNLPVLSTISTTAVRQLFHSLCRDGATSAPSGDSSSHRGRQSSSSLRDAVRCWEHLYGPVPGALETSDKAKEESPSELRAASSCGGGALPPPIRDVHELLNLYAAHGIWESVLGFFCNVFLHRPAAVYLTATPADLTRPAFSFKSGGEEGTGALHQGEYEGTIRTPSLFPYTEELPLDAVTLNLVFAALPKAAEPLYLHIAPCHVHTTHPSTLSASSLKISGAAARPVTVVRLLDDLLELRDDIILTDFVLSVVGPALLQVGQADRVFELLQRTPMMVAARNRKAPAYLSWQEEALKTQLGTLGYAAYALCPLQARRHAMVRQMPHLFPPEVVRRFAAAAEANEARGSQHAGDAAWRDCVPAVLDGPVVVAAHVSNEHGPNTADRDSSPHTVTRATTALAAAPRTTVDPRLLHTPSRLSISPSLLDVRWRKDIIAPLPEGIGPRQHRKNPRGSATLTTLADDAMRRDYQRLRERRHDAFKGDHVAASRDPRPIPKGLHDHASGWDFYGRGGEMVFSNHKRTPHPLSMRPKVMRDVRNPYRGWNPRRNSSLAHKENVTKWNGKSSV